MRKLKVLASIIILLIILLIVSLVKYINEAKDYNRQCIMINDYFASALQVSASVFDEKYIDYNNQIDENQKSYIYSKSMSHLLSAVKLFDFTTYHTQNIYLGTALNNLYSLMERIEYKEAVMSKSQQIYEALYKLAYHPEDKQAADALIKLTQDISQYK
jgi:hypothetical protein